MKIIQLMLGCLLLVGCYSGSSLRVTRGEDMVRERGNIIVNPIRMTEISGGETLLDLGALLNNEKMLEYFRDNKQEVSNSYSQKSVALAGSAGKALGDSPQTNKATSFDPDKTGNNETKISYSELIELAANSQLLARGLVRRFNNIQSPSSEHKIYCIPVDITFFPGTVTEQNYRADVLLKFKDVLSKIKTAKDEPDSKKFKIFAIAPYEYSKVASQMQSKLKELFLTFAAKGTLKGVDIEGRFDETIRNFNQLQNTLSRPEFTATLLDDDTIVFSYRGYSDLDRAQHLVSGESFRCELFAYFEAPDVDVDKIEALKTYFNGNDVLGDKNINIKAMRYDYMWQYTPTKDFRWFNPGNWGRSFPSELWNTAWTNTTPQYSALYRWWLGLNDFNAVSLETANKADELWRNYRYCRIDNQLWIDNLITKPNTVTVNHIYLVGNASADDKTQSVLIEGSGFAPPVAMLKKIKKRIKDKWTITAFLNNCQLELNAGDIDNNTIFASLKNPSGDLAAERDVVLRVYVQKTKTEKGDSADRDLLTIKKVKLEALNAKGDGGGQENKVKDEGKVVVTKKVQSKPDNITVRTVTIESTAPADGNKIDGLVVKALTTLGCDSTDSDKK